MTLRQVTRGGGAGVLQRVISFSARFRRDLKRPWGSPSMAKSYLGSGRYFMSGQILPYRDLLRAKPKETKLH